MPHASFPTDSLIAAINYKDLKAQVRTCQALSRKQVKVLREERDELKRKLDLAWQVNRQNRERIIQLEQYLEDTQNQLESLQEKLSRSR